MKQESAFLNVTVFLAAIPALLYAAGTAHRNGFLQALKLNESILDQEFHLVLYHGFVQLMGLGIMWAVIGAALFMAVAYVFIPIAVDTFTTSPRLRQLMEKHTAWPNAKSEFENNARIYAKRLLVIATTGFSLLIMLVYFERSGKSSAMELMQGIALKNHEPSLNIMVESSGKSMSLIHIICGTRNCAGHDPKDGYIVYYPQEIMRFPHVPSPED